MDNRDRICAPLSRAINQFAAPKTAIEDSLRDGDTLAFKGSPSLAAMRFGVGQALLLR